MTKIVGILNITDNSFSDETRYNSTDTALARYDELLLEGADYIDIGAEATSYGVHLLTHEQEWQRLAPVLTSIHEKDKVSIDTYHPETAQKAIDLGYSFINDVSGGRDERMLKIIAATPHVKYVLMHCLVLPADRNIRIKNTAEMYLWAEKNIRKCLDAGINQSQLIFDPGLGFTTYPQQGFEIIKHCEKLKKYNVATYIGHSRKSIFDKTTALQPKDRDVETLACSIYMYGKVDYLRVHNVTMHTRALKVWQQLND